jgi:endonuclease V-like protein UPF0215 family
MIKEEIRIIGWDDCRFRFDSKKVLIVGVIFRGSKAMDGLLSCRITKDGLDATEKISSAIKKSRHYDQLSIIMLDGISYAGFNLVDIKELSRKTGIPVIVIQRKKPDMIKFLGAQKKFGNYEKRKNIVKRAGKFYKYNDVYYQKSLISSEDAEKILDLTCSRSNIPEPVRVAHLIASGLSGESRGRA